MSDDSVTHREHSVVCTGDLCEPDKSARPSSSAEVADAEAGPRQPFACWAILELMGHRRLAGRVSEQEIAGHGFVRLDVPEDVETGGAAASQFYSPSAVYCLTPTTEELARSFAANARPVPISTWDLRPRLPARELDDDDGDDGAPRG